MFDSEPHNEREDESAASEADERRNGPDRRTKSACGYTCISIVGWICRREQSRRKNDSDPFADDAHFNPRGDT